MGSSDMGYDYPNPESPGAGMLDVHPPHSPTHTWKDFFIHIATIVVGLLIAVGLEQTVEYFHHRRQVAEAREALREERHLNQNDFAHAARIFGIETRRFQTNLNVLLYIQQHPKAKPSDWPGSINWHNNNEAFADSAWTTIQHSSVTELLPQAEVRSTDRLYKYLAIVDVSFANRLIAVRNVRAYLVDGFDPAHLTPTQLEDEIQLARIVLASHYRLGGDMRNLAAIYKDFTPAPRTEELNDIMHEPHLPEYTASPSENPSPSTPDSAESAPVSEPKS